MDIKHVVVLMLENRSFDSMLGMLYQSGDGFDGLTGTEQNIWHKPGRTAAGGAGLEVAGDDAGRGVHS